MAPVFQCRMSAPTTGTIAVSSSGANTSRYLRRMSVTDTESVEEKKPMPANEARGSE